MIIWRCDACGAEATSKKIVGEEFGYVSHGFGTLAVEAAGKRDLCRPCMAKANAAFQQGKCDETVAAWNRVKSLFGSKAA